MKFNIVLYSPEIAQNVGNIIRTCVATNFKLHLIEPLGFKLDDKELIRCSANHMEALDYEVYKSFEEFQNENPGEYFYLTRYGKKAPTSIDFTKYENIYLIFGKESTGIPLEILKNNLDSCFRIPMSNKARCLNISNAVAICAYEVLRQFDYPSLEMCEPENFKGADFLLK